MIYTFLIALKENIKAYFQCICAYIFCAFLEQKVLFITNYPQINDKPNKLYCTYTHSFKNK